MRVANRGVMKILQETQLKVLNMIGKGGLYKNLLRDLIV